MPNCTDECVTKAKSTNKSVDKCIKDGEVSVNEVSKCKVPLESAINNTEDMNKRSESILEGAVKDSKYFDVPTIKVTTACGNDINNSYGASPNTKLSFVSKYFKRKCMDSGRTLMKSIENVVLTDDEEFDQYYHESDTQCLVLDEYGLNQAHIDSSQESDQLETSQVSGDEDVERDFRLSQINCCSDEIIVESFFNISPRAMPESPHKVIEEEFKSNPWVMLVATIFLTKTTGLAARPFMKKFFADFPTPYAVIESDPSSLKKYFETLGMYKRAAMIWKMSYQFVSAKWRRASDLYGIGKYGEDAYRLFCLGHTDVEPTDRYLRLYLDWLLSQTNHGEEWSISDCEGVIFDPVSKYYTLSLR